MENKVKVLQKLFNVQQKLKAPKGQKNDFGNYNFRSCEDILEAVKPFLAEEKAVITISDKLISVNERTYIEPTATFWDIESGEFIFVTASAREALVKKGQDDSQITGSASSYARKYALNGLLAIDNTKDADATNKHGKDKKNDLVDLNPLKEAMNKHKDQYTIKEYISGFKKKGHKLTKDDERILTTHYNTNMKG